MSKPKWATPERQAQLIRLWEQYGNRCLWGHPTCPIEKHYLHDYPETEVVGVPVAAKVEGKDGVARIWNTYLPETVVVVKVEWVGGIYFLKEEAAIAGWVADDHEVRERLKRLEQARLHQDKRRLIRGPWDTTAREQYHDRQPLYHLETISFDALTMKRVAKIRIASTPVRLWVEIPYNRYFKWAKKHKNSGPRTLNECLTQAVNDWLANG